MTIRSGYFASLEHRLLGAIDQLHLTNGHAGTEALVVALVIFAGALFAGLLIGTQLVAPSGSGPAFGIALAWIALALAADAVRFQLAPMPAWQQAVLVLLAAGAALRISRDLLDASAARTTGALLASAFFGSLIALLLALGVQMANAI